MVFAREISDNLTSLVKKIDESAVKNSSAGMNNFVVFLSDSEGLEKKLKALAKKLDLKKTILTIDNPAGPPGYRVAKGADVTVVLYVKKRVKVNHAFKKGELKDKDIKAILAAVPKILPE
jgi:hypothetical protein